MRFTLTLFILVGIIDKFKGNVFLKVQILNYKNEYNLMSDGGKCESFHYLGDHCDPLFEICVGRSHSCDILKEKLRSWHNRRTIENVYSHKIFLDHYPSTVFVKVRVDDHDSYDSNDHIAEFSTIFDLTSTNRYYHKQMSVNPYYLSVSLEASLTVQCQQPYNGDKCRYRYNEQKCIELCGNGQCVYNNWRYMYFCRCTTGWTGEYCTNYFVFDCSLLQCVQRCTYTENFKNCVCTSSKYNKHCREFIPEKIKTTTKLLESTISSSTILPTTRSTLKSKESTIFNTTVSTMATSTRFPSIKTSQKYVSTKETENLKTASPTNRLYTEKFITNGKHIFPETTKFKSFIKKNINLTRYEAQTRSETNQKLIEDKIIKEHYPLSTIIIICLLVLLCISILALIVVIRNNQKWKIIRSEMPYGNQRPLPQVRYQRDHGIDESLKYIVKDYSPKLRKSDDGYESCIIIYNENSDEDLKRNANSIYEYGINDPYEEPIINHMESLTCETDYNSDHSDIYEKPIKPKVTQ